MMATLYPWFFCRKACLSWLLQWCRGAPPPVAPVIGGTNLYVSGLPPVTLTRMEFRDGSWCCWNMNRGPWLGPWMSLNLFQKRREEIQWCALLMFLSRINFIMRKWIQFRSCHPPFFDFLPLQWLRIWMRQGWRRCFRSLATWFQWNSPGRRDKLMEGVGLPNDKISGFYRKKGST